MPHKYKSKMPKKKVLFIYPNVTGVMLLPISVPLVSAVLKMSRFDVELFDTTFYDSGMENFEQRKVQLLQVKPFALPQDLKPHFQMYSDLATMVNDYCPDVIAFTVVEDTIALALKLLQHIEPYAKDVPVVFGGVGATFNSDILKQEKLIDVIVRGESERIIPAVFQNAVATNKAPEVIWDTKPLLDMDTLPIPDYSIFPESRIVRVMSGVPHRMLQIEVDRGCPYVCAYCGSPALRKFHLETRNRANYYRRKSAARVVWEMRELKKRYQPTYFDFNSETFLARRAAWLDLKKLMTEYKKYIDLPFWCQTRLETVSDPTLKLLKECGVSDMQFGVEHGNSKFRREYLGRKGSNTMMREKMELVEKYEIPYTVNMIMGWAHETRELIWDSINILKGLNPKTINVYKAVIYRGCRLYDAYLEAGLITKESRSNQLLRGTEGMKRLYMTEEEVDGLQRCFPMYVRMPEVYYPQIERAEKFDTGGNRLYAELREIFIKEFYS